MSGAEREAARVALVMAALRLPLAPWVTPEIVAQVVDGLLTRVAVAIMAEQPPPAPKAVAGELERLRKRLDALDESMERLSPAARAALRQASIGTGDRDRSRLRLELARLGIQVAAAQERPASGHGSGRPPTMQTMVGIALVGAIERLTGKPATYTSHPITSAVSGTAVTFVSDALAALGIDGKPEPILKGARDRRSDAGAYRARKRAERRTAAPGEPHDDPVKQGRRVRRKGQSRLPYESSPAFVILPPSAADGGAGGGHGSADQQGGPEGCRGAGP